MESEMNCKPSDTWSLTMPEGLDLEVSHRPLTMKRGVNLIIAMERLKGSKSESVLSTDFRDENLLSIILDNIVEKQLVFERSSAPPDQFSRTGQHHCSVTDSKKRSLVLVQSSMELHAVTLQGGSTNRRVNLNMSTYVHPAPTSEAWPVALGIKDTNLYLSCHNDDDKHTLHLETVEDENSLQTIDADSDMLRFLFYKQDTGKNISTLMSARFPQWFISTAMESQPVVMCTEESENCQTFYIQSLS